MAYLSDIEIAQSVKMQPISQIAETAGIDPELIEPYGKYKAKLDLSLLDKSADNGKLILVTAITPTPQERGRLPQQSVLPTDFVK